ncbi:MAG: succinylarginine dihydrolase [Oceanospirillaceae bacterium]|nr:succinylarginine dihydrolase [Oceanospirillaceae bacterium]
MTSLIEVNFDGLVGPTHHYGGLAEGNLACQRHAGQVANPRQAALQGLEKMRKLVQLGVPQGWLPPHPRPDLEFLRRLGFAGTDAWVIQQAAATEPELLSVACSSSSMWAANSATATSGLESQDGRLHLTPANLVSNPHRALEPDHSHRMLSRIFGDTEHFCVHEPLPAQRAFGDEGAANHTRLGPVNQPGVDLFVYGANSSGNRNNAVQRKLEFPARQTQSASQAIARLHGCTRPEFLQQSAVAINAGAFHNDVVAVGHRQLLFHHQQAFETASQQAVFATLRHVSEQHEWQQPLQLLEVPADQVSLEEAVSSYLFNSQLLSLEDGSMMLLAPMECGHNPAVYRYLTELINNDQQPIARVDFVDLKQSMANGGGSACLRLRVPVTSAQLSAIHPAFLLDETRIDALQHWVKQFYRDRLELRDLADPHLLRDVQEGREALEGLIQGFGKK